jgi:hypothetical protein
MSLREKINELMDFTPSCDGPLPGMTRGGDYLLKSDVLRVIASENAAGDALTRQFNAAEELAERVMKLEDERADLQARLEKAEEALIAIEPWCVRTESVQLSTNKEYAAASNKVHAAIDAALSKKAGE